MGLKPLFFNMSNQPETYIYNIEVTKITDGDTIRGTISLGYDLYLYNRSIRIFNLDTPESRINIKKYPERAKEKELGLLAKQKVKEWLVGKVTIRSYGPDKYGRILADVYCEKGNIADLLIAEGLAVPYDGGTKKHKWS